MKKLLLVACSMLMVCIGLSGLEMWDVVHGDKPVEAKYRFEIDNQTYANLEMEEWGLDGQVNRNSKRIYELTEMQMKALVKRIDDSMVGASVKDGPCCPEVYREAMELRYSKASGSRMFNGRELTYKVSFCMASKCDMSKTDYPGGLGLVQMEIADPDMPEAE